MSEYKRIALVLSVVSVVIILAGVLTVNQIKNKKPVVDAGNDQFVDVGEIFYLNGSAYDPDGRIVLYEWDFDGDGIFDWVSENNCKIRHYYNESGVYNAVFRAKDNEGAYSTDTIKIYVKDRLLFNISINKTIFQSDEEIFLTVFLQNIGDTPVNVSDLSFGFGNVDLIIASSNGSLLKRKNPIIPGVPSTITLLPTEKISIKVNLSREYEYINNTGEYSVKAIYRSDYYPSTWTGILYSDTLAFTITNE